MNGARNRRHGHASELLVVGWLKKNGYPDTHTTRAALGHGGTRQRGDVAWRPGVVLEVKSRTASAWPTWIARTESDCQPGENWIVVRRIPRNLNVGEWPAAYGRAGDTVGSRVSFAQAVIRVAALVP